MISSRIPLLPHTAKIHAYDVPRKVERRANYKARELSVAQEIRIVTVRFDGPFEAVLRKCLKRLIRRNLNQAANDYASPATLQTRQAPSGACDVGPPLRCECFLGGSECRLLDLNPFPHDSFDPFVDPTLAMKSGEKRGPSGQLRGN